MRSIFLGLNFFFILFFSTNIFGQSKNIEITYKVNSDRSVDFYYSKKEPGSYTISLSFTRLENAFNSHYNNIVKGSSGKLISLKPINKEKGIAFSYKFSFIRGVLNPKVDSSFVYRLPFKRDTALKVYEMNFLGTTYFGSELPKNWKAYQFITSADTVYAARKGIVIDVKNKYDFDSISYYTSKKNTILIEHKDGTVASYEGFAKNKLLVKEGDIVYPQTPLGTLTESNSKNKNKLAFKLYFLIDASKNRKDESLLNQKSRFQFITPIFLTDVGIATLIPSKTYKVKITNDLTFKEFTRKERKRFK